MDQQQPEQDDEGKVTAKRLSSCNYTDQVSILVGPDSQLFIVHKDVICARPKFFRAACSERWLRGKEKKVTLPDVDSSVFRSYLSWVYSGQVDVSSISDEALALDGEADVSERARNGAKYLELYILGDVLDDVRLRNKAIQTLIMDTVCYPRASTTRRVWEKTPETSPI